ncbi:peptidase domain-containing ABC transporter [Pseudescherichia sp.]|uniref:peptidase domain-containing ABC transporter n=1 Tax=Pseudescherichia sp. TaxID=2055881 RepID=UPI00289D0272|nr:peptidase domain-containing ABC transporter [Pseudescherichia sp.]
MTIFDRLSPGFGRRLPVILQTESTECGLACIAMVAGYYGNPLTLSALRSRFAISLKGTDLRTLMNIAQKLDLGVRAMRVNLEKVTQLRLPCILHWNFKHFVVLKKVSPRYAVIHDPARGVMKISLEELSHNFTGVALDIWPSDTFEPQPSAPRIKLRTLFGSIKGLNRSLLLIIALAICLEIFSLVQPLFLQWVIDEVIVSSDTDLLTVLVIGFALLLLFQQATYAVKDWTLMFFSTTFNVQWRANVFSHLISLPVQYFERRHLGDVISRFGAIDTIQQTLSTSFLGGLIDGMVTIVTLTMMFIYSPMLATIALAVMILYGAIRAVMYRPLRQATEENIISGAKQQSHFLETIRGLKTIKLFNRQPDRRESWLALFVQEVNSGLHVQKLQLISRQINGLLFGLEGLLIIWLGAKMVINKEFTVGVLITFNAYKMHFDSRVSSLIDKYFEVRMLRLQGERLSDIVLSEPEGHQESMNIYADDAQRDYSIRFDNVSFRYAEGEPEILKNVSFCIMPGESVAVVGASGCGKTTLINILLGVLSPSQGQILLGDIDISRLGVERVRQLTGTVLQDDLLFAGTIADNICFFDPAPDFQRMMACAALAAVHDEIVQMPMAYSTLVGDMGTVLSGGQKQRVLLARAIYKQPRILLLDEATSHLDIVNERAVTRAIDSLNMTRLFVAHRPETIASASRVIVLEQGAVSMASTQEYINSLAAARAAFE